MNKARNRDRWDLLLEWVLLNVVEHEQAAQCCVYSWSLCRGCWFMQHSPLLGLVCSQLIHSTALPPKSFSFHTQASNQEISHGKARIVLNVFTVGLMKRRGCFCNIKLHCILVITFRYENNIGVEIFVLFAQYLKLELIES